MDLIEATYSDYEAVTELVNLAYRGAAGQAGWTCERELLTGPRLTVDALLNDLKNKPQAHLLVYREAVDEPLLGTVWLEAEDEETWYLGLLTVRPAVQDRQLGRELLSKSEVYAKDRGAKRVRLTVLNVRETLIAWYERRGYESTGETQPFPCGDERFGSALRDDLEFVVLEKEW